jgi:hypothetical protein
LRFRYSQHRYFHIISATHTTMHIGATFTWAAAAEIRGEISTGANFYRSIAVMKTVCVPPPLPPTIATRLVSASFWDSK